MLELSSAITDRLGSCFDLLVADVLVDDTLRPWLLECNESPSLATNPTNQPGALDIWRQMKEPLVRDLLSLIGAEEDAFGPDDGDARFIAELRRRRAEPLIPGRGSSGEVPTVSGPARWPSDIAATDTNSLTETFAETGARSPPGVRGSAVTEALYVRLIETSTGEDSLEYGLFGIRQVEPFDLGSEAPQRLRSHCSLAYRPAASCRDNGPLLSAEATCQHLTSNARRR